MSKEIFKKPIFPTIKHSYNVIDGVEYLTLVTNIRKKRGKKWFLWCVITEQNIIGTNDINMVYQHFIKQVYAIITLGKIPAKMITDRFGVPLFPMDTNQQSEKERVISLAPRLKNIRR